MRKREEEFNNFLLSIQDVIEKNSVIKSFLKKEDNFLLMKNAILYPTNQNKEDVNERFKEHYKYMSLMKYISKLIHYYSIDYDKRINKLNKRFLLTLDRESDIDNPKFIPKDYIKSKTHLPYEMIHGNSLKEIVGDEKLYKSLEKISIKQLEILDMIYIEGMTLTEISIIKSTSVQNISNQHTKAIKKIREEVLYVS